MYCTSLKLLGLSLLGCWLLRLPLAQRQDSAKSIEGCVQDPEGAAEHQQGPSRNP